MNRVTVGSAGEPPDVSLISSVLTSLCFQVLVDLLVSMELKVSLFKRKLVGDLSLNQASSSRFHFGGACLLCPPQVLLDHQGLKEILEAQNVSQHGTVHTILNINLCVTPPSWC